MIPLLSPPSEPTITVAVPTGTRNKTGVANIAKRHMQAKRKYTFAEVVELLREHWTR